MREEAEEERRAKRARDRELAAAMEVAPLVLHPAEFCARMEHQWAAERRQARARAERRRLRDILHSANTGMSRDIGSARARLLARRARCLFGRADFIQLSESFAALDRGL